MKLRLLNDQGLTRLRAELQQIVDRERSDLSPALLSDPTLSEEIAAPEATSRTFKNRWEVATELEDLIERGKLEKYVQDPGFWGWLTVFYFDEICPRAEDGTRPDLKSNTGVMRYYPQVGSWRHYYRHLLAGPWMVYRAHRDDPRRALPLLATAVTAPGDVVESIASRQEFVTSATIMECLYALYYNPKTGKLRKGSGRKERGSVRRFVIVLQQFDVTYDLYSLTPAELIALLPREFDEFKDAAVLTA